MDFIEASKDSRLANAFLLSMDTGLRMGEFIALTWDDVDLKYGAVSVNKNVISVKDRDGITGNNNMLIVQDRPKTKASISKVPLTQRAVKMLMEMKLKNSLNCKLVFPTSNNTYLNPRNFERAFQFVVAKLELKSVIAIPRTHFCHKSFSSRYPSQSSSGNAWTFYYSYDPGHIFPCFS